MAQIINTNMASLNAQRNLNSSQAGTNQALQRLSSGLRINSAKDDAAGLAISTRFESQIKGLNVAIRNAGDGVSLAQTAEGALGSMTDNLQRIRELALQAANGTNSVDDRLALQAEAKLLIEEIGRVSEGANFNGVNLLDGSLTTSFQVGANAGETISVSIAKLTADTLGVSNKSGVSSTSTSSALGVGDLVINGVTVGSTRASDDSASTNLASASAISKAAAINRVSAESGVTAVVQETVAAGSTMTAAASAGGSVTINGTAINIDTTLDAASSRAAVVTAINAQSALTGVTAVDSGDDALGVSLVAADGRNIELSFGGGLTADATGLSAAGTYTGGVTLVAHNGVNSVTVSGSNVANAGLAAGTYTAGVASVSSTAQVAAANSGAGSAAVAEVFTLTVSGTAAGGTGNLAFTDGAVTVNAAVADGAVTETSLAAFITAYNAEAGRLYDVAAGGAGGAEELVFTARTAGDTPDIAAAAFTGAGGVTVGGVVVDTQGADEVLAGTDNFNNLDDGDLVINNVAIGAARAADDTASYTGAGSSSKEASGISIAAAINRASDSTGVTATVNATVTQGATAATAGTADATAVLHINGVEVNLTVQDNADANRAFAVNQINAVSGQTGVIAEDNGSSVTLTAADGRNIVLAMDSETGTGATAANFGLGNVGTADFTADVVTADQVATTTYSTVTLSSAGSVDVKGGINGDAGLAGLGLQQGSFGGAVSGQFLTQVDISTQKGATDALAAIDNALGAVNAARADLGAVQNRFEATISALEVNSENLSAANSRIRDADFAAEAANLARFQVLQQAGISILAQANSSGEQVLSLLR